MVKSKETRYRKSKYLKPWREFWSVFFLIISPYLCFVCMVRACIWFSRRRMCLHCSLEQFYSINLMLPSALRNLLMCPIFKCLSATVSEDECRRKQTRKLLTETPPKSLWNSDRKACITAYLSNQNFRSNGYRILQVDGWNCICVCVFSYKNASKCLIVFWMI